MRRFIARRFPEGNGGRFLLSDIELSVNLSLVLHKHSNSAAVASAIRSIRSVPSQLPPGRMLRDAEQVGNVDLWLAPSLGFPEQIDAALNDSSPLILIDGGDEPLREVTFFRAPAQLALPDDTPRTVGIVALIGRPGGRTSQLIVRGPFSWPADRAAVLHTLESLIQAHVEQWQPGGVLWSGPAEEILPELVKPVR